MTTIQSAIVMYEFAFAVPFYVKMKITFFIVLGFLTIVANYIQSFRVRGIRVTPTNSKLTIHAANQRKCRKVIDIEIPNYGRQSFLSTVRKKISSILNWIFPQQQESAFKSLKRKELHALLDPKIDAVKITGLFNHIYNKCFIFLMIENFVELGEKLEDLRITVQEYLEENQSCCNALGTISSSVVHSLNLTEDAVSVIYLIEGQNGSGIVEAEVVLGAGYRPLSYKRITFHSNAGETICINTGCKNETKLIDIYALPEN